MTDPSLLHAALHSLAMARLDQGRTTDATAILERLARETNSPAAWSEWLFYGLHDGSTGAKEHAEFAAKFPVRPQPMRRSLEGRKLRIACLSPNIRSHTVPRFLIPILRGFSEDVETYIYYDNAADKVTETIAGLVAVIRPVRKMSDGELYQLIVADKVDCLIDVTGHMNQGRRQTVIAARPAALILGAIGYSGPTFPHSTRVTDSIIDPTDTGEPIMRLPGCAYAFEPRDFPLTPCPSEANGYVTFGSLNRICKVSPSMAGVWASIVNAVPGSRLTVLAPGGEANGSVRRMFEGAGVPAERLRLDPGGNHADYARLIDSCDINLDPSLGGYSGHTTSFECSWQGVPTITVPGDAAVSRVTASMLIAMRLGGLVATSEAEYVAIAVALAQDAERRKVLRQTMRDRMSPLIDGRAVAGALEAGIRAALAKIPELGDVPQPALRAVKAKPPPAKCQFC